MSAALVEALQPTEEKKKKQRKKKKTHSPRYAEKASAFAHGGSHRQTEERSRRAAQLLEAAHALKQNDFRWRDEDGWRGGRPISHSPLDHACCVPRHPTRGFRWNTPLSQGLRCSEFEVENRSRPEDDYGMKNAVGVFHLEDDLVVGCGRASHPQGKLTGVALHVLRHAQL